MLDVFSRYGEKSHGRGALCSVLDKHDSKMVAELLPDTGKMHHSWKAGLENSMCFADCLVPICNSKRNFETMDGLFLSVQIPAFQIQLVY